MYVVVSKWQAKPGREAEFDVIGRQMRERLRSQPGVEFLHAVEAEDGSRVAVAGYRDRGTWDRIVNDPNGPFAQAAAEHRADEIADWLWSERGEVLEA